MQNEIARLKKLLANSPDGAVGGVELSDGAETSDDRPTSKDANRLEIELRAAREQISSKLYFIFFVISFRQKLEMILCFVRLQI